LAKFLHVGEKRQPADQEHPVRQVAAGSAGAGLAGAALAGAIDEIAMAKPATKSNEAFIAMSSQKLRRDMPIPERKITRLRYEFRT
jgi:CelD/BcsL family acetyltransferase involved in cellulose biosynthesis